MHRTAGVVAVAAAAAGCAAGSSAAPPREPARSAAAALASYAARASSGTYDSTYELRSAAGSPSRVVHVRRRGRDVSVDAAPATALFARELPELAVHSAAYDVKPATAKKSGAPTGAVCFAVTAQSVSEPVRDGTYCFTAGGLVAAVRYPSGETVRLASITR